MHSYKLIARPVEDAPFERIESVWQDVKSAESKYVTFDAYRTSCAMGWEIGRTNNAIRTLKNNLRQLNQENYNKTWVEHVPNPVNYKVQDCNFFNGSGLDRKDGCNDGAAYKARRSCFTEESYEESDVERLVDNFVESDEFDLLCRIASNDDEADDEIYALTSKYIQGPKEQKKARTFFRDNARRILRDFGYIYSTDFYYHKNVTQLIEYYIENPDIENLCAISRCLTNDDDGIYSALANLISEKGLKPDDLRAISQNSAFVESWGLHLFNTEYGHDAVYKIKELLISLLCNFDKNKYIQRKNPTELRDYLECLLSLCCINKEDPNFLNPNSLEVKNAVKAIKKIDNFLRENRKIFEDNKKPFICRLEHDVNKKEAHAVHDLNFMLIQVLSGQEDIKLTGFDDGK